MIRRAYLAACLATSLAVAARGDELLNAGRVAFEPAAPFCKASFIDGGKKVAAVVGSEIQTWLLARRSSLSMKLDGSAGRGALAVSPDGRWTAASGNGEIKVWRLRRLTHSLAAHEAGFRAIQFLPDSELLASWGRIEKFHQPVGLSIWDADSGELRGSIYEAGKSEIHAFAFAPDGKTAATLGALEDEQDPRIALWDLESFSRVAELPYSLDVVPRDARLTFSSQGEFLALNYTFIAPRSNVAQQRCQVWDVGQQALVFPPGRGRSAVAAGALSFSPDAQYFAAGSGNDALLGTLAPLQLRRQLSGHEAAITWTVFSPDGSLLATASVDWTVILWDVENGQRVETLRGHRAAIRAVQFSPDGDHLLTIADDGAKVWDIEETVRNLTRRSARK